MLRCRLLQDNKLSEVKILHVLGPQSGIMLFKDTYIDVDINNNTSLKKLWTPEVQGGVKHVVDPI